MHRCSQLVSRSHSFTYVVFFFDVPTAQEEDDDFEHQTSKTASSRRNSMISPLLPKNELFSGRDRRRLSASIQAAATGVPLGLGRRDSFV